MGVGKSNGDKADDDDNIGSTDDGDNKDDEYEEDDESPSKKTDDNSGDAGVSFIEGLYVVQNHNPQSDNVGSNFVGLPSHLALYYDPPLGPFSEYVDICTIYFIRNDIYYFVISIVPFGIIKLV
jgi:hypothetical protein